MNKTLRNILTVIAGIGIGGLVNSGIVMLSGHIIPPPEGADFTTTEGLRASTHLMQPKHFIFPFLAHALGTLTGAFLTTLISGTKKFLLPMIVGIFFLIGGVSAAFMIPAPTWFVVLDLVVAYIPMAWLGYRLKNNR